MASASPIRTDTRQAGNPTKHDDDMQSLPLHMYLVAAELLRELTLFTSACGDVSVDRYAFDGKEDRVRHIGLILEESGGKRTVLDAYEAWLRDPSREGPKHRNVMMDLYVVAELWEADERPPEWVSDDE
jgi:hypothetical protein